MQSTQKRSYLAIIVVASVLIAATAVLSIMLPFGKFMFPKSEHFYAIYYGHLVNQTGEMTDQANRILVAKPELVIVQHSFPDGELNLTPEVHHKFSATAIKVLTYSWTNYGLRDLKAVLADIDVQMASGVDGIFVDEVTNIQTDAEYAYYSAIFKHIKSFGQQKLVVMNPGHYQVNERIMQVSDIVSFEEEWVYHDHVHWMDKYASSRFMGVSSNEYCSGCVNDSNAANKTKDAWNAGIGYHFATDKYIDLPTWFDRYALQVGKEKTKQL